MSTPKLGRERRPGIRKDMPEDDARARIELELDHFGAYREGWQVGASSLYADDVQARRMYDETPEPWEAFQAGLADGRKAHQAAMSTVWEQVRAGSPPRVKDAPTGWTAILEDYLD